MREARALAKRLDALREQQADELLARLRAAQALMERAEAAHGDPEAVLDDADWRRAMAIRAAAQEQLAMLDGMTPAEYLKYIKEEDNEGRRDSGAIQAAGGG